MTTYEALVDELCEAGGAAGGGAIGGYSSFSDTDLEEEAASGPPDPLLQPALAPVTWMEWGNILKLEGKRRPSDWGEDTQEGSVPFIKEEQEEDRGREANMDEAEEAGINWAALRRGLEWRHRWLELRCRELASQAARQKAALRRLGVWAKGQGHGPSSLSTAPPSSLLAIARPSQPHKRRRRTAWSLGPGAKSLEEVPFFAHHALGRLPSSLVQGKECGSFSTIGDDEEEGAVIYEDLERVSARLQQLRATLVGQRGHRSKAKRSSSAAGEASKAARGRSGSLALRPGESQLPSASVLN